jgi:hypothetical protein
MLTGFLSGLGGKLADRLTAASISAALFGALGIAAWIHGHGDARAWHEIESKLSNTSGSAKVILIAGAIVLIVGSALLIQRLALPALRLLEGYYWPEALRRRAIKRVSDRVAEGSPVWQELASKIARNQATAAERRQFVTLDRRQRWVPADPDERMPTRVGNSLRAAELWPKEKYGLDAVVCWTRLWLVMPESAKGELMMARARLDAALAALLWSLLAVSWTAWTVLVLPVVAITGFAAYLATLDSARLYGTLVEAAFDLYRPALYQTLRWPLPTDPTEDLRSGAALSEYLWRGSSAASPTFAPPQT